MTTLRALNFRTCPVHGEHTLHRDALCVSCNPPPVRPPPSYVNSPIGTKHRFDFNSTRRKKKREYFGQPPTKREKTLLELALTDMRITDMGKVIGTSKSSAWGSLRAGLWKMGHETRASYQQHMKTAGSQITASPEQNRAHQQEKQGSAA